MSNPAGFLTYIQPSRYIGTQPPDRYGVHLPTLLVWHEIMQEVPVRLGGRVLLAGVNNLFFFGLHRTFCFLILYIAVVCARCVIVPHFYRKITL
jgi:hypothetical protein